MKPQTREEFIEEIQVLSATLFERYLPEIKRSVRGRDTDYLAVEAFGCASGCIARYFWDKYLNPSGDSAADSEVRNG